MNTEAYSRRSLERVSETKHYTSHYTSQRKWRQSETQGETYLSDDERHEEVHRAGQKQSL